MTKTHLQIRPIPLRRTLERQRVQARKVGSADVHPVPLADFLHDRAYDLFLRCWDVLHPVDFSWEGMKMMLECEENGLTRRALLSTHHRLLFFEQCSSPARVAITSVLFSFPFPLPLPFPSFELLLDEEPEPDAEETCNNPGPSLRLTCCAGTVSPGKTMVVVEVVEVDMEGVFEERDLKGF